MLGGQVVNQAERIVHVAARKIWLVFDDFTTVLHEPELGLLSIGFLVRDLESDDLSPRSVRSTRKFPGFLVGGWPSKAVSAYYLLAGCSRRE
jgi:hypothetical protein